MKKTLLSTLVAGSALLAAGEEQKTFIDEFNEKGYGLFSGQVQSLTMVRDYNDYATSDPNGDASTIALTLGYQTPEFAGFTLGAEWITSATLWENNPNRVINNNFNILNNAYLNWNLEAFDLKKSNLTAGRFAIDTLMMPDIAPRQKSQAMEGVVFTTEDIADSKLLIGWIRKFSSWSTLDYVDANFFNHEFTDVDNLAGVDYSTSGTYFIDYTYTGIDGLKINIGDYLSEDIFNNAFADITWSVTDSVKWRNIWAHQDSVGRGDHDPSAFNGQGLRSDYLETSLIFEGEGDSYIRPGLWYVPGEADGGEEHGFQDLFQSNLTPTWPFMANPYGFYAGTTGYFVEGFKPISEKDWLWAMLVYTDLDNNANTEPYDSTEFNIIWGHDFNSKFSTSIKFGVAHMDGKNSVNDTETFDGRFFITYKY